MNGPRRPRLVPGVRIIEQIFQGEQAFVARSPVSGSYVRFRAAEARVMGAFDGARTTAQVAELLASEGLNVSAQSVDGFASRLSGLGFVERSLAERSSAQLERLRVDRMSRRRKPLFRGELLRMRWRVADPDRILTRTLPWLEWCFTPRFVRASLVVFAFYVVLVAARWTELTTSFAALASPATLTLGSVAILWVSYVTVGAVHELGHAYACKHFSGEVNDMGVMLLYFQPAFYCNVNDAWSFSDVRHRLWVTAAGGWIELLLGASALLVWSVVAPGTTLSAWALALTIFSGGITLLSNANPLLPFDGYFALSDWLEIPNLRQRARAYFRWWVVARLMHREAEEPEVTERERRIFLVYGACSAAYITFVLYLLSTFVLAWATRLFGLLTVTLLLAALAVAWRDRVRAIYHNVRQGGAELYRGAVRERVRRWIPSRRRGWLVVAIGLAFGLMLPWPRSVDGWWTAFPVRYAVVTAPIDGIVDEVLVNEGGRVAAGAPLLHIANRALNRERPELVRQRDSLGVDAVRSRAGAAAEEFALEAEALGAAARVSALEATQQTGHVRAPSDGVILTTRPEALVGRRVAQGTPLVQLGETDSLEVRIVLRGSGALSVTAGQTVSLMLDGDAARPIRTSVGDVSPVANGQRGGVVEARVRLRASAVWRAGVSGPARVRIARSTVGGALLWAVRSRLRPDLLL